MQYPQDQQTLSSKTDFLKTKVNKALLITTILIALVYFYVLCFVLPEGNRILFGFLVIGEIFHLWQVLTFIHTIWDTEYTIKPTKNFAPEVDVFITVAGEPTEIVRVTAESALAMDYPNFKVHILNDGFVAKKENWKEIESLAQRLNINCITRKIPGGAKAGNINNALKETNAEYVAIFDADHSPNPDFLKKTIGYFSDSKMAFVQSPQFYKNSELNNVTGGAWEQQELFFGPICKGKNRLNSVFMCGTNMVIRKKSLLEAGGMCESNIAEDFLTSLFIHERGWKSVYVPEVLAEGLAPEDFLSYYKQQLRWARGSLEVIFKYNPLFRKGLTFRQKIEYLGSASFYLSGVIVLINALLPLIFFYTGLVPMEISTMSLAAIFLPYIFFILLSLRLSSNFRYTFRALAFSMASFYIHIRAIFGVIFTKSASFSITSKKQLQGSFTYLVYPHLIYLALLVIGIEVAILREGVSPEVVTNLTWALVYVAIFVPFIFSASPKLFKSLQWQMPATPALKSSPSKRLL
jgi:cellulose synthase (UDP-forming)